MGRRKIEIQPLADDRNRTVTFVKRKAGLFKKAHELAVLCQVDLAVIIIGSNNKLYEFASVDTNELIEAYKKTKVPHESKAPANYGNYQKKKHLTNNSSVIHDDVIDDNDIDSEFDSDTPEPKRQKRSYDSMVNSAASNNAKNQHFNQRPHPPTHISLSNVPTFNNYRSNPIIKEEEEEDGNVMRSSSANKSKQTKHYRTESMASSTSGANSHRPILRVQIPTDPKGNSSESAQTITALDTNLNQGTSSNTNAPSHESGSNSAQHSANSNEANNAAMPNIVTPKFSSFGQFKSPDTRKPITTLPVPVHSKSQTSSPQSATAPGLPVSASFFSGMPQGSPSSQFPPNSVVPTPVLNQVFNQQYPNNEKHSDQGSGNPQASLQINLQNKYRSYHNSMGGGEQTPVSGLPSRYVNDIFPSPSNFYAPQEWPVVASGMTPFHNNLPQYFMNMPPTAAPSSVQANSNFQVQRASQAAQNPANNGTNTSASGQGNAYQNYQRNDQFQYMGPFNSTGQPTAPEKKIG